MSSGALLRVRREVPAPSHAARHNTFLELAKMLTHRFKRVWERRQLTELQGVSAVRCRLHSLGPLLPSPL